MKKTVTIILAAAMLLACAGCGAYGDVAATPSPTPDAGPSAEPAKEGSTIDFSLKLFSLAAESETENTVISPLSAYLLLCLAANGAEGDTLSELETTLGASSEELNALCVELLATLTEPAGRTILEIANSAWIDNSLELNASFRELAESSYDAEINCVDMDTDATRKSVNDWVREKTHGLIESIRGENYDVNTLLALINTVYFNAKWQNPFSADDTQTKQFTTGTGDVVNTEFLGCYGSQRNYVKGNDVEGILLPYDDGKTAFLAIRPTDGSTAAELAQSLTEESLNKYLDSAVSARMNFSMPIFSVESTIELMPSLGTMGLNSAFDPSSADFSRLVEAGGNAVYISSLVQKAKITVDEDGTEAAAVTEMTCGTVSVPVDPPVELCMDSPFVYAIIHLDTGMPIFLGVLNNATA